MPYNDWANPNPRRFITALGEMRSIHRQLVCGTLLALYGVISLLGHGLHWLSPEERHHHGRQVGHCEHDHVGHAHHHHGHAHHHHAQAPLKRADRDRPQGFAATECATLAHDCDICTFLLQARSERPQLATTIVWHQVVAAALAAVQRSYSPISLGPHAARGPPSLLA